MCWSGTLTRYCRSHAGQTAGEPGLGSAGSDRDVGRFRVCCHSMSARSVGTGGHATALQQERLCDGSAALTYLLTRLFTYLCVSSRPPTLPCSPSLTPLLYSFHFDFSFSISPHPASLEEYARRALHVHQPLRPNFRRCGAVLHLYRTAPLPCHWCGVCHTVGCGLRLAMMNKSLRMCITWCTRLGTPACACACYGRYTPDSSSLNPQPPSR